MNSTRCLLFLASASFLIGPFVWPALEVVAEEPPREFHYSEDIEPLLEDLCFGCHGKRRQRGDLNIEAAVKERPLVRNLDIWTNVLARLKKEEMPPKNKEQPSEEERQILVEWLDRSINHFDYSKIKDPGYEPVRRLTHNEYSNTVQVLFGMPVHVTDKFPSDLSGTSGFDNSANTLFFQTPLLERYVIAAEDVIERALPSRATTPEQEKSRALIFVAMPDETTSRDQAARQILERFLERAYRRPATQGELEEVLEQFRRGSSGGKDFEEAIKQALKIVLISPNFLLRIEEGGKTGEAYRVNAWQLATRLSYFLWTSMPDDELFELARQKKLRDPDVLDQQIQRMLADPKSKTLGDIFAAQWLGFDKLGTRVRLDPIDNPWCTDSLMNAMKEESALFFHSLLQKDRPLSELIDANYTYLNEELARHYDMEGVKGPQMRRVTLKNSNRGGIFCQGSLLAITSFPHRTSPVVRGKWILADVLGKPPPPPPPNAGELSDEVREKRRLTLRQKLELHREDPQCNSCHSQMDPLGFSLENFDLFGRWRTRHRRRPIDATGRLPNGTEFQGPAGLKRVIVEQRMDDLVRQVTRKMLSYALGRQLEYYDEPAVRKIIGALEQNDSRLQTLICEIVNSYPFQYKKNRSPEKEGESL